MFAMLSLSFVRQTLDHQCDGGPLFFKEKKYLSFIQSPKLRKKNAITVVADIYQTKDYDEIFITVEIVYIRSSLYNMWIEFCTDMVIKMILFWCSEVPYSLSISVHQCKCDFVHFLLTEGNTVIILYGN